MYWIVTRNDKDASGGHFLSKKSEAKKFEYIYFVHRLLIDLLKVFNRVLFGEKKHRTCYTFLLCVTEKLEGINRTLTLTLNFDRIPVNTLGIWIPTANYLVLDWSSFQIVVTFWTPFWILRLKNQTEGKALANSKSSIQIPTVLVHLCHQFL